MFCVPLSLSCDPLILQKYSLRGRRLKRKGKGVLGARETRVVSRPNSLPLPFRTPATQASKNTLKIFRKETVREVLHDLICSMKRLGSMDTRWRTVPFFVSLNFTAELVECISLWRVKVNVYSAIYLTGNRCELHIDHLHVLWLLF